MADVDLTFLAEQMARMLSEQRAVRDELRGLRLDLRSVRDELGLLREQVRIEGAAVARLDDTISMNVLDRLRRLESGTSEQPPPSA